MYPFKKGYSIFLSTLFVAASFMALTGCPNQNPDNKKAADSTVVKADTPVVKMDTPAAPKDSVAFKKNATDKDTSKDIAHPH